MTLFITLVSRAIWLYQVVIIAYVLMSWFPLRGIGKEIYDALGTICEPYLSIFRKFIPVVGNVDISPIIALIVLSLISYLINSLT